MPRHLIHSGLILLLLAALALPFGSSAALHGQSVDGSTSAQPADTVISPVAGGWTLLANLGEGAAPALVLGPLLTWVTAAFTYDAALGRFHTFRVGQAPLNDLSRIEAGQAFWVFVPPERLDGDLAFWEQPALVHNEDVALRPGFNLVAWSGDDGATVSQAVGTLPIRRAYSWDATAQRFDVWNPELPPALQNDFVLEYGAGLWIDLGGSALVTWTQP